VWLDLSEALALLDAMPGGGEIEIKLRHARDALACVPTALSTNDAGAFLVSDVAGLASAATRKITAAGVALPDSFADAVRADPSKGVILIEGRAETTEPLVLEIWRKGRKALEKSLPLRVAPVEQMYARVNLRDGAAAVTPGSRLPPANGTNVVFLHGYNVDAEKARGWHAEMFKRLWQSGSKARFHGVTWKGDERILDSYGLPAFHYHENVENAFLAAPYLKNYVNGLSGEKIMMAHSLGNMVVSSDIADHGMGVDKFFMFNAAVPAEAFDPALTTIRRAMRSSSSTTGLPFPRWRLCRKRSAIRFACLKERPILNCLHGGSGMALIFRTRINIQPEDQVCANYGMIFGPIHYGVKSNVFGFPQTGLRRAAGCTKLPVK
jgi:hypothetical protein